MNVKIFRTSSSSSGTAGILSVDGAPLCDTLEPPASGLRSTAAEAAIRSAKARGLRAIPLGRYLCTLSPSPRFSGKKFYKGLGGLLPRLHAVPCFDGVLIHCGNTVADTAGCILVGRSVGRFVLGDSRKTYRKLFRLMSTAAAAGQRLFVEVTGGAHV